jgi:hypothetical protein
VAMRSRTRRSSRAGNRPTAGAHYKAIAGERDSLSGN